MISDDGIDTMFVPRERGNSGWDVSARRWRKRAAVAPWRSICRLASTEFSSRQQSLFRLKRAKPEQGWFIHSIQTQEDLLALPARSASATIRARRARAMIVLWRVTEACNLACGFCAYDRRLKFPRASALPQDVARGLDLFGAFAQARGVPVHISWLGGEPLLWRPLQALVNEHAPRGALRFSATTNGTRLNDETLQNFLLAHFSELTISLDAMSGTHDRLRGRDGLWAQVREGVKALSQCRQARRLKLRVNAVLMQSTLPAFSDLCHEIADWGIDEMTFNALGGRDRPDFFPAERILPAQWSRFCASLPELRTALASKGLRLMASASYLDRIHASISGATRPVIDCAPGEDHLFIDCDGRVSPCHQTGADYAVGL